MTLKVYRHKHHLAAVEKLPDAATVYTMTHGCFWWSGQEQGLPLQAVADYQWEHNQHLRENATGLIVVDIEGALDTVQNQRLAAAQHRAAAERFFGHAITLGIYGKGPTGGFWPIVAPSPGPPEDSFWRIGNTAHKTGRGNLMQAFQKACPHVYQFYPSTNPWMTEVNIRTYVQGTVNEIQRLKKSAIVYVGPFDEQTRQYVGDINWRATLETLKAASAMPGSYVDGIVLWYEMGGEYPEAAWDVLKAVLNPAPVAFRPGEYERFDDEDGA